MPDRFNPITGEWEPEEEDPYGPIGTFDTGTDEPAQPQMAPMPMSSSGRLQMPSSPIATPPFMPTGQPGHPSQPTTIGPRPPRPTPGLDSARSRLSTLQSAPPSMPNPGVLNRLGAAAVGGLAGYLNTSPHQRRPIDTSSLQRNILYPGFDRKSEQWQRDVQAAQGQVATERQGVMDQSQLEKNDASSEYMRQQGEYMAAKPELEASKNEVNALKNQTVITREMAPQFGLDPAEIAETGLRVSSTAANAMARQKSFSVKNENDLKMLREKLQSGEVTAAENRLLKKQIAELEAKVKKETTDSTNATRTGVAGINAKSRTDAATIGATSQQDTQKLRNEGQQETQRIRNQKPSGGGGWGLPSPRSSTPTAVAAPAVSPDTIKRYQDFRKSRGLPAINDAQAAEELTKASSRK
jgi:hypothetical protein